VTLRWAVLAATVLVVGAVIGVTRPDHPFAVDGSFILWDDYRGKSSGALCSGERSVYHGINPSTPVTLETVDGVSVAQTVLGQGRIASGADLAELARAAGEEASTGELEALMTDVRLAPCLFSFRLDVERGADGGAGYVVVLGRWG